MMDCARPASQGEAHVGCSRFAMLLPIRHGVFVWTGLLPYPYHCVQILSCHISRQAEFVVDMNTWSVWELGVVGLPGLDYRSSGSLTLWLIGNPRH